MKSLMLSAGWGSQHDLTTNAIDTTTLSLDSFEANAASILPAGNVYVGYDEFVAAAAAAGPPRLYQGALAEAGEKFGLEAFCRGIVDPAEVWFFSTGGTTLDLVFVGF
jgi:hypothetical protein